MDWTEVITPSATDRLPIDPNGTEAIFQILKLCAKGYVVVREVGFKEAVRMAKQGWSVKAPRKTEANKVSDGVGGGAKKPEFNKPHQDGFMPTIIRTPAMARTFSTISQRHLP